MATEDWTVTSIIYDDRNINSIHDNRGRLLSGSIEVVIDLNHLVCSRLVEKKDHYRFWTLEEKDLILQVVFWCYPKEFDLQRWDAEEDFYHRVNIQIHPSSKYPTSFPCKDKWIDWLHKKANDMIKDDQISFSIIDFLEHQCFDYLKIAYHNDDTCLIVFDDKDRTFYDCDSIVLDPRSPLSYENCFTNGTSEMYEDDEDDCECRRCSMIKAWKSWLPRNFPICFDNMSSDNASFLPCDHEICNACIEQYLQLKVDEIQNQRNNPFVCPITSCRHNLPIIKFVKPYLSCDKMTKVREWYKDIKNPPCYALPECLRRGCAGRLRKEAIYNPTTYTYRSDIWYHIIFCEICNARWCELCIKRLEDDDEHSDEDCKIALCNQFCQLYLAANEEKKKRCDEKWPFIKLYAHSQLDDITALQWITSNGQVCPGCKTGVERSEGCFHMKCSNCPTHFCYECGEELLYPYYGTHHCWER